MSLLMPERLPAKVYKWDDAGAPVLNKTANCMEDIFKACLVTGYGTKEGAGWSLAFEADGVKVLRPSISPDTDFYLRMSADTGTEVAAQVYLNMTDASTGDLKLQCTTPFKYAKGVSSGKWLLVATSRGVWFFCEQMYGQKNASKTGAWFFCGDTTASSVGDKLVYLHHSGGTFNDGDFANMMAMRQTFVNVNDSGAYVSAKVLSPSADVNTIDLKGVADGLNAYSVDDITMPPLILTDGKVYMLPALFLPLSGGVYNNFHTKQINLNTQASTAIVFGATGNMDSNVYISTDWWYY